MKNGWSTKEYPNGDPNDKPTLMISQMGRQRVPDKNQYCASEPSLCRKASDFCAENPQDFKIGNSYKKFDKVFALNKNSKWEWFMATTNIENASETPFESNQWKKQRFQNGCTHQCTDPAEGEKELHPEKMWVKWSNTTKSDGAWMRCEKGWGDCNGYYNSPWGTFAKTHWSGIKYNEMGNSNQYYTDAETIKKESGEEAKKIWMDKNKCRYTGTMMYDTYKLNSLEKPCICPNGYVNSNKCPTTAKENTILCSYCRKGYKKDSKGACTECNMELGYYKDGDKCKSNQCTCANGVGAPGNSCPEHGTAWCTECENERHVLVDGQCRLPQEGDDKKKKRIQAHIDDAKQFVYSTEGESRFNESNWAYASAKDEIREREHYLNTKNDLNRVSCLETGPSGTRCIRNEIKGSCVHERFDMTSSEMLCSQLMRDDQYINNPIGYSRKNMVCGVTVSMPPGIC